MTNVWFDGSVCWNFGVLNFPHFQLGSTIRVASAQTPSSSGRTSILIINKGRPIRKGNSFAFLLVLMMPWRICFDALED
jgi:hypothetical protein